MTKSQRKRERHETKIRMAAYHYLKTSTDGAVICNLSGLKPYELNGIFKAEDGVWIGALRFWQPHFKGEGEIEGEYFKHCVGERGMRNNFSIAANLWKHLFNNPAANRLKWYFNDLDAYGNEVQND